MLPMPLPDPCRSPTAQRNPLAGPLVTAARRWWTSSRPRAGLVGYLAQRRRRAC